MKRSLVTLALVVSLFVPVLGLDLVQYDLRVDVNAPENAAYFDLSTGNFSQDWTNATLIAANDNWTGVPSLEGYLGQDLTTSTAADPQTLLGTSGLANDLDVIANQTNTSITNGGVAEFDGIPNPTVALQGSGTADAPYLIVYLNTTGRQNVQMSYNLRDLDATADNSVQQVALQYRVGASGNFTNVPAGYVPDATSGPSAATLVTPVNVTLPAAVENQSQVQVRIMTTNAVGNDEWVGVDDIVISSSPAGGGNPGTIQLTSATYSGGEAAGQITLTGTRTGGSSGAVSVSYNTASGTATSSGTCGSGGNDFAAVASTFSWADGDAADKSVNVPICEDAAFEGDETFNFNLTSPTGGAALGSPSAAVVTISDNDPQPSVVEFDLESYIGDESQTAAVTVSRSGDTSGTSTVNYSTANGTAGGGPACGLDIDFVATSGSVTFGPGETLRVFNVQLCGDSFREMPNESLALNLSNPSGSNTVIGANSNAVLAINDTASEFRNSAPILIEDGSTATLYPSTIDVTGAAGPIGGLRVTLYGMNADDAADIDVMLVGPQGQQILLMADAGGTGAFTRFRTLTFNDAVGRVLPQTGEFETGEYEPTSWGAGQANFAAPAPNGPYNEPGNAVGGSPSLASVFGGSDPNGTWSLYVRDDSANSETASIAAGWGLEISAQAGQPLSISGRALLNGRPVRGVYVYVSGGNLTQPVLSVTSSFGYYTISGLQAGQTYSYQVLASKYSLTPASGNITVNGNLANANIFATLP